MAVPLIARGGPAGALIVFNRPDEPSFDEFTVRRLARFARLLARNVTQDLDPLTGLLSWNGFKTRVTAWLRDSEPAAMVSMLYGDIDRLHVINDLAGFSDGDRVIARCGGVIRKALVGADSFACRLSGDRFTVFLPHMNLAQARQLAGQRLPRSERRPRGAERLQPPGVHVLGRGVDLGGATCISIIASPRRRSPARPPRTAAAAASRSTRTPTRA